MNKPLSILFWVFCTLLVTSPPGHAADSIQLTFAHFVPPQHIQHSGVVEPWAREIEKLTNNKLKIIVSHSSEKGTPPELFAALNLGIIDMTWLPLNYIPNSDKLFPLSSFLRLPFLIDNSESGSVLFWKIYQQYLQQEYKDFKVLWLFAMPPSPISTKSKPVKRLEDMAGLKLALGKAWIFDETLKLMGATVFNATVNEMAQVLQVGLIDGVLLPFEVIPPFKMDAYLKYHTIAKMLSEPMLALMNKKNYEALPSDIRQVLDANTGGQMSRKAGQQFDIMNDIMSQTCVQGGAEIINLPPGELQRFRDATQSVRNMWIQKMEAQGLPGKKVMTSVDQMIKHK